jgi:hypothetical protein
MGYMHFISPVLEQLFKSYKYARNNSIKIFDEAVRQDILGFHSTSEKQNDYSFQSVLFQFQCMVSTTDTYYRKLTNAKNKDFGVYVTEEKVIPKQELSAENIKKILSRQLEEIEDLLKSFDEKKAEKYIDKVSLIMSHEYLHQGELILMFREAAAKLPESYVKAWAL